MANRNNLAQLIACGISCDDAAKLRRISLTLHSWHEHECNGTIQREGDNGDGSPFWYNPDTCKRIGPANDLERGALKRLAAIMTRYPTLSPYVQGDPRGCALYILRPGDVPHGQNAESYYSRGIAVY